MKADPTIAGMKQMLTELCTKEGNKKATTKTAREKHKLTALLDFDDENEHYSKQKRKDKYKKTNEPLTELETEEEVVEDTSTAKNEKEKADNKAEKKKKSKKNKK